MMALFLRNLSLHDIKYMYRIFDRFSSIDFSGFDTSMVKNMSFMFNNCTSLQSIDFSSFDTSKVKDMKGMFRGVQVFKH